METESSESNLTWTPARLFNTPAAPCWRLPWAAWRGAYDMLAEDGVEFASPIPIFNLSTPHTLH